MRGKIPLLLLLSASFACNDTKPRDTISAGQLNGEWNNLSLKVDIHSKKNSDSSEVFEVNRPEWEGRLKIKPIRTFFREDSTWNSAHYNLNDSLVYNPSGKWWIEGDSLVMMQQFPSIDITRYALTVNNDTASFTAMLDWDEDGKKDDKYFGQQVKVKK